MFAALLITRFALYRAHRDHIIVALFDPKDYIGKTLKLTIGDDNVEESVKLQLHAKGIRTESSVKSANSIVSVNVREIQMTSLSSATVTICFNCSEMSGTGFYIYMRIIDGTWTIVDTKIAFMV